jgi:hypothetical protein
LLVVKKQLLAGGEDELAVAIGTDQDSVYELDFHVTSPGDRKSMTNALAAPKTPSAKRHA